MKSSDLSAAELRECIDFANEGGWPVTSMDEEFAQRALDGVMGDVMVDWCDLVRSKAREILTRRFGRTASFTVINEAPRRYSNGLMRRAHELFLAGCDFQRDGAAPVVMTYPMPSADQWWMPRSAPVAPASPAPPAAPDLLCAPIDGILRFLCGVSSPWIGEEQRAAIRAIAASFSGEDASGRRRSVTAGDVRTLAGSLLAVLTDIDAAIGDRGPSRKEQREYMALRSAPLAAVRA